jgi:hypothetical protein
MSDEAVWAALPARAGVRASAAGRGKLRAWGRGLSALALVLLAAQCGGDPGEAEPPLSGVIRAPVPAREVGYAAQSIERVAPLADEENTAFIFERWGPGVVAVTVELPRQRDEALEEALPEVFRDLLPGVEQSSGRAAAAASWWTARAT